MLGSVGDLDVVLPVLVTVLENNVSYRWWHRAEARNGLRALWRRQTLGVTLQYFTHANLHVRRTAVESFRLQMTAQDRVERVYGALVNVAQHDLEQGVRSAAMNVLSEIVRETDDINPYIEMLANDTYYAVREGAAGVLGTIGNVAATQPLIDALARSGELLTTKGAIAEALGNIGDPRAVEPLVQLLFLPELESRRSVRTKVIEALGNLRDVRAVDPLIQLLTQSTDTLVRRAVLRAFGEIGDVRAVQPTIMILENLSLEYFERATAATALGDIGSTAAVRALEYARDNDPHAYVRNRAEAALQKIQAAA